MQPLHITYRETIARNTRECSTWNEFIMKRARSTRTGITAGATWNEYIHRILRIAHSVVSSINLRAIDDLFSKFRGDNIFWKWRKQIQLLRTTYNLDNNSMKVLISSRKIKLLVDSTQNYLELSVNELLDRMKVMFDLRPTKVTMSRNFERRTWQSKESFSDYFHDKIILDNRAHIDEEMLEYIIDGIPDIRLRDQAWMQRFRAKSSLLKAFRRLKLRYDFKNLNKKNNKFTKPNKLLVTSQNQKKQHEQQ